MLVTIGLVIGYMIAKKKNQDNTEIKLMSGLKTDTENALSRNDDHDNVEAVYVLLIFCFGFLQHGFVSLQTTNFSHVHAKLISIFWKFLDFSRNL